MTVPIWQRNFLSTEFVLIVILPIKQTVVFSLLHLKPKSQDHKTNQPNFTVNFSFDILLFFKENKCVVT